MAAVVIWLVIIFAVVAFNKKSVSKSIDRQGNPLKNNTGNSRPAGPAKKDNRSVSGTSGGGDILSRAKASVEEDFGQTWEQEEEERREAEKRREQERRRQQAQKRQDHQGLRGQGLKDEPKELREADISVAPLTERLFLDGGLSLGFGTPAVGRQGSLDLDEVWDLIVKGPNMEIAFERDFIAEGVEMLNRIQA